jgi:membrane protease YdiL (CAAX protease family)
MDLTQTEGLIFWLYVGLFCSGLLVWAWVGVEYAHHRPCLKIDPWPRIDAIGLGAETLFMVMVFFLLGSFFVRELLMAFKITFPGPDRIAELSQGLISDIGGKLIAGGLLVYLLKKHVQSDLLFEFREVPGGGLFRRLPIWSRVIVIAGVLYLAIFPLVNDLILRLSVFLFEHVLRLPVPEGHQAFQLLDHPDVSPWVKGGTLLLAGVISPVVEELFFRGLLQNMIYKTVRHPGVAIGITGFLFMVVHVPMYHQLPALGVLGIILGWSYYRYRSLAVPIVTHILFNSTTLLFWWLGGTN